MTTKPFSHVLCFVGMFMAIFLWQPPPEQTPPAKAGNGDPLPAGGAPTPKAASSLGRLVVIVVDAWNLKARTDLKLMPEVHKLAARPDARWVEVKTCVGNFTLPCLQTLFEGRESPFSSGLHNYTGRESSGDSLAGIAAARGLRVANVSDQSLTSLYGGSAVRNVDCSTWVPDPLKRDLRSVDEAISTLVKDRVKVLLYHIPGTDKLSHAVEYGTARYIDHYAKLDTKLAQLFAELDFSKDALVITGDHGHGHHGHHTFQTPGLFVGQPFAELFGALKDPPKKLVQEDLIFFFGYPQMLPLPPEYEGKYFADLKTSAPDRTRQYLAMHQRDLAARGFTGDTLAQQVAAFRRIQLARPMNEFKNTLPGLLCFLALLVWLASPPRISWRERLILMGGFGLATVGIILVSSPARGLWVSIIPGAALLAPLLSPRRRERAAMLLLLIALSALLSYVAVDWKAFFHIKDGGSWTHPLFYSLVFLVGLPLAKIGWGRFGLVAYGSAAFAFFALPNGPYYYQSGSNMFQSFVRAAALVGLVAILKRGSVRDLARQALSLPGRRLAAAILVIFTPWLFAQDAGGWVWQSYSEKYMRELLGLAPTVAIYYIMGALLIWALPDRARRIKFGLLWVFSHAYVVGVAEVTTVNFVSSQMPIMVLLGWFLWRKQRTDAEGDGEDPLGELGALVVMAAICTNLWFILRGFTVANADWGFCYTYLGWARHDAVFFGLALVLCIPKYGMGLMTALVFISMLSTPCRVSRLFDRLLLLTMFKMAFYFIQVLFGSIRAGEKLHELAVGGVIYLSLFIPMVGGLYLLLWSFHKIRTKLNP